VAIVAFGLWCVAWPVNRGWRVAPTLVWGWVVVEVANGILHPLVALIVGRYIGGAVTAPVLLVLALRLAYLLKRQPA